MIGIGFKKKTQYFFYVSVIASVSNFIGNLLLVPYLGAKGAAISTGLSYIIFFSARTYFSTKLIDFGFNLKRIYSRLTLSKNSAAVGTDEGVCPYNQGFFNSKL